MESKKLKINMMNNFTEEEIQAAKITKATVIREGNDAIKSIYPNSNWEVIGNYYQNKNLLNNISK